MAEVKLVLTADNKPYIKAVTEAQTATQKLHDTSVAGEKREKGILEEIDATLIKLQKSRQKAFTYEDIEKYNKKIEETKQNLKEYEEAGLKVEKSGNSMMQSIGKWVMSLSLAVTVLNALKEGFLKTTQGMKMFEVGMAGLNQIISNAVNGVGLFNQNVGRAMVLAKQWNELKRQENIDSIKQNQLMREYNELYLKGIDQTITAVEKITFLTEARNKFREATEQEIKDLNKEFDIAIKQRRNDPTNIDAENRVIGLINAINQAKSDYAAGLKRLNSQISGEEKRLWDMTFEGEKKASQIMQDEIDARNKEILEAEDKSSDNRIKSQEKYYLDSRDNFFQYIDDINEKKAEQAEWDNQDIEQMTKYLEERRKLIQENVQAELDILNEKDQKEKESSEVAVSDFMAFADDILKGDAQSTSARKELADKRVADKKQEVNKELALAKFGQANNLALKQQELAQLQQLSSQATAFQMTAIAAVQSANIQAFAVDKALAIATVIIKAQVAKMGVMALGPAGFLLIPVIEAAMIKQIATIVATSLAGIAIGKLAGAATGGGFAKGGWTGDGGQRDATGERMAGVVHEREYVVRKGPAYRYRDVLEAINRDDKNMVFNSFNKISPVGNTNVIVENEGPNKRLDAVISEQKKLNAKLTNESYQDLGNVVVVKRGNTIRTIRR